MNYLIKLSALATVIIFAIPTDLRSQNENSEVGIKGGASFSNFYSEEIDDQNMRIGFQGGLFFKAALTDFLAIQPELLYTQKGSKIQYDNFLTGEAEFSNQLNYLELPVMGVLNITENFNLQAGPYFAYLINANVKNEAENDDFNFVEDLNEEDFERFDYGIGLGAGFEFETLRFGVRYNYGLEQVGKEQEFSINGSEVISNQFADLKNSTFNIYLGLSL